MSKEIIANPLEADTFAKRVSFAVHVLGGNQSHMARRVAAIAGRACTAQNIQKIATGGGKSNASGFTVAIAKAAGLNAEWLAYGHGDPFPPKLTVVDRAIANIRAGNVPAHLVNSFNSMLLAISDAANDQNTAPFAAERRIEYDPDLRSTKKEVTA